MSLTIMMGMTCGVAVVLSLGIFLWGWQDNGDRIVIINNTLVFLIMLREKKTG